MASAKFRKTSNIFSLYFIDPNFYLIRISILGYIQLRKTKFRTMTKSPHWLFTAVICFMSTLSFTQVSLSNYATYSLEVLPYKSQYGNILTEKDIDLTFSNLTRVSENGDLYIRVEFIRGLKSNYLLQTAIPGTGFAYRIDYRMPRYKVSIVDENGILVLQKIYGGEKRNALFGEFESISSVEDLKFEWETNRDEFYAKLESQPEEIPEQKMDEELLVAIQGKAQEMTMDKPSTPIDEPPTPVIPEPTEPVAQETRKKPESRPSKANVNIYKRPDKKKTKVADPSEPKLSPSSEQIYDLNGFIEVDACSKYSYQLRNKHPFATMTVYIQDKPENDPEELILTPGETKFMSGLPHRHAWIVATYQRGDFQEDQIVAKEDLNMIASDDTNPRIVTDLLDQFFAEVKPQILFAPKFNDNTDEVADYVPENKFWQEQLKAYLAQKNTSLTKGEQNKIARETEKLLAIKAIRSISERIEQNIDSEDQQKLIYPIIKASKNFRNVTPFIALEYSQSAFLNKGISEFWNTQQAHRASISFRLPVEWQLSKRKSGAFSTLNIKASFESIRLDFNQSEFQAYAIDPGNNFPDPEPVLEGDQFAIQATQLSAGLAWKLYFPLPILEIEGGAFFSHKTRLLWGQDQGQFPRSLFSPENEIITDVVDLSSFRPYFGAKIGIPFYLSGYKFNCDSNLRNAHVFAGFRMYPVDFSKNDNYNIFIRDAADIDFIPIPLENGQSKFLMHLMVGGAVEF